MLGIVGAETPAAELVLHLERSVLLSRAAGDVLALAVDGGVRPALGIEAVGAADKKVVRIRLGQHPDVVLTLVLRKREERLLRVRTFTPPTYIIWFCESIRIKIDYKFPQKKRASVHDFSTVGDKCPIMGSCLYCKSLSKIAHVGKRAP